MWKYLIALSLSLALCAPLSAQVLPSQSAQEGTPTYTDSSTPAESSWNELEDLLTMLMAESASLNEHSKQLETKLTEAQTAFSLLSSKLAESQTQASELKNLLLLSETSLETSRQSLSSSRKAADSLAASRNLWRAATIIVGAAGVGGIIYMAFR